MRGGVSQGTEVAAGSEVGVGAEVIARGEGGGWAEPVFEVSGSLSSGCGEGDGDWEHERRSGRIWAIPLDTCGWDWCWDDGLSLLLGRETERERKFTCSLSRLC